MNKFLCCLLTSLTLVRAVNASAAEQPEGIDYNLTMAGSLVSNWCEPNWETQGYLTADACNYQLAQLYNLEVSSVDFGECTVVAGGDIVRIAECMVERFDGWLVEEELEETKTEAQ